MPYHNVKINQDPAVLREPLKSKKSLWVGALSFEERCSGSLSALAQATLQVTKGLALDYPTQVHPSSEDKELRDKHWEVFEGFKGAACKEGFDRVQVDPYSFSQMQDVIQKHVVGGGFDFVLFDITCLTKVHALAVAAATSQLHASFKSGVAYSIPENYGSLGQSEKLIGWKDVIIAPLAETASLSNEAHSRGVIIPGHEADRLIVALAELEPSGGLIVFMATPNRPDLHELSLRNNRQIIRQLTSMRSANWSTRIFGLDDWKNLNASVAEEIAAAKKYKAPVILFPFGPKSLLFLTAFLLASDYPEASWFVCPIPTGYNIDHSEGIERTVWLIPNLG